MTCSRYAPAASCESRFITPTPGSSGIYYDKLLDVKFYNDHWNIITYLDVSHIQPHLNTLDFMLERVSGLCNSLASSQTQIDCVNILTSLRTLYISNVRKFSSVSYLILGQQNRRTKRGLIDAGGSILKTLFGTLDSGDAEKFNDAINEVQSDENKLAHLMKDNIHVIKSTITTFNSTISRVKENEIRLNHNLNIIEKSFEQISNSNEKLEIKTRLNSMANAIESIMMTLSFDIDDINNAILFSKLNILHPTVLNPYQLYTELEQNKNKLPKHCDLPVSLSLQNVHELIDISRLISYYQFNKVVIILKIPLVIPQTYNLYNTVPFPVPYDISKPDTFALIIPNKSYLAITSDRMFYSHINNLDKCKVVENKCFVCPLESVMSTIANPICETVLLTEIVGKLPNICEFKLLRGLIDIFYKLSNNKWIYVQSEPGKCHFICENEITGYDEIILGTGLLTLPKNCKAFYKTLQFTPSDVIITNFTYEISKFNIIRDDCCEMSKINKTLPKIPLVKLTNINDMDSLIHASVYLDQFEKELSDLEKPSHFVKYSTHYISLTYVITFIICMFVLYKSRKILRCKQGSKDGYCIQIFNQCRNKKEVTSSHNVTPYLNKIHSSSDSEEEISVRSLPVPLKRNIMS